MSQCGQTNLDVCVQKELEPVTLLEDRPNVPATGHHDHISKGHQRSR
jgi:hypothetical protein